MKRTRSVTITALCLLAVAQTADSAPPAPPSKPPAPPSKPPAPDKPGDKPTGDKPAGDKPASDKPGDKPAGGKPAPAAPAPPTATPAPQGKNDQAALDLVAAWAAAQNKGDFAAYQALYAKRFAGIRRSGPRVRRFDRKGWLADRERMFAKKMEVAVESPVVSGSGTPLRVGFTQKFAQGNFKDSGSKILELVREDGEWRITREEMLDSKTQPPAPAHASAAPPAAYDFGFFVDGDMVLGKADASWAKAEFTHKGFTNDFLELRTKANDKKLPPAMTAVLADKVRLVRFGGSCVGRLRSPDLRGRVVPHFSARQAWSDADQQLEPGWINEAWAQSDQQLVSTVDGCPEGGFFVRHPSLPEVTPVAPEKPVPAVAAAARRAFAALADYKAIDQEFKATGGKGHWTAGEVEVLKATTAAGPVTLVWVSAREGEGCGGFAGELTALFKAVGKEGAGKLETLWAVPSYMRPVAAFDLDGDALPELLINTHIWGGQGGTKGGVLGRALCRDANCQTPAEEIETPMLDCPC